MYDYQLQMKDWKNRWMMKMSKRRKDKDEIGDLFEFGEKEVKNEGKDMLV